MKSYILKILLILDFTKNMGWRYVSFRLGYLFQIKTGFLKSKFPTHPEFKTFISLKEWRDNTPSFFFQGKCIEGLQKQPDEKLKSNVDKIQLGYIQFFSHEWKNLGKDYNWVTNPETGYQYDIDKHWSQIESLTAKAGDIKFVWEKARFSYLYDIIRYDYHFDVDCSKFVFSEIEDFIDNNPINQGPNYVCSQEISLRILNWTFALYFYKDSEYLTPTFYSKLMNSVYWQLHHVYRNINFSRIAVRNNHALTETLMLYLSHLLFPCIPDTKKWSAQGKAWFEEEIAYQIYEDGTFLQFSMNYHRVAVQLLTWGLRLAELNEDQFQPIVYERAQKSLEFLDTCLDPVSGKLPNYGANDGALFFKLTNDDYRVYTSQLDDLRAVLNQSTAYKSKSYSWYGISKVVHITINHPLLSSFEKGGYYLMQEKITKTFIKCGKYKDRPFQSDNLHVDIWHNGINYFRDSGSFKYNTDPETLNYFVGVGAHNTVAINGNNQMLKAGRFIWFYWIKNAKASLIEREKNLIFNGNIKTHKKIDGRIHNRKIIKGKNELLWKITDSFKNVKGATKEQYWHINPDVDDNLNIQALDENGEQILPIIEDSWFSSYYGHKTLSKRYTFATTTDSIITSIKILH